MRWKPELPHAQALGEAWRARAWAQEPPFYTPSFSLTLSPLWPLFPTSWHGVTGVKLGRWFNLLATVSPSSVGT